MEILLVKSVVISWILSNMYCLIVHCQSGFGKIQDGFISLIACSLPPLLTSFPSSLPHGQRWRSGNFLSWLGTFGSPRIKQSLSNLLQRLPRSSVLPQVSSNALFPYQAQFPTCYPHSSTATLSPPLMMRFPVRSPSSLMALYGMIVGVLE